MCILDLNENDNGRLGSMHTKEPVPLNHKAAGVLH